MTGRTARRLLVSGLPLAGILSLVRPAIATTDDGSRLLVLLRGQSGHIQFVNSVTRKPVAIRFRIGTFFHDFAMSTDETTEAYYTNGLYAINPVASRESANALRFCSIEGIHLTLGFHELEARGGCLEVRLLWTRSSGGPSMSSRS